MRQSVALAVSATLIFGLAGCDWAKKKPAVEGKSEKQLASEQSERIRKACASEGTYDRLKELVFDEAARIRNSDPRNLDPIAAAAVVRMEEPVVKSRDEELNVTVCTGRFVLELPPGAANAFDGKTRVEADVEYAAQAAADGSGLVYQMDGAEPIIFRLATFGMAGGQLPRVVEVPQPSGPPGAPPQDVALMEPVAPAPPTSSAPAPPAKARPLPKAPAPVRAERPKASPEPPRPATRAVARPSFNCRHAKTSTEKRVCGSPALAARDRQMASLYYAQMANADPATRRHLRRSRDAFLARRERCGSDGCVAAAYDARMSELRRIRAGD